MTGDWIRGYPKWMMDAGADCLVAGKRYLDARDEKAVVKYIEADPQRMASLARSRYITGRLELVDLEQALDVLGVAPE